MKPQVIFFLVFLPAAHSQVVMGTQDPVRLLPSDAAVLETKESRTDLPCTVKAIQPEIGFDLGFHTGFEVTVPVKELEKSGDTLVAIFRVLPEGNRDKAIYLSQKWTVPAIPDHAGGTAHLRGAFVVGAGKYQVEWLMRDRNERFCTSRWQIWAAPRGKDRQIEMRFPGGAVARETSGEFDKEEPVKRDARSGFHVVVLLHIASQNAGATEMHELEKDAVLSIVRNIAREPRIGSYSITTFNLERNEVLYRSEKTAEIDFPALGEAVQNLKLGTIDVKKLRRPDSSAEFLSELIAEEMEKNKPDAWIFVGPKTRTDAGVRGAIKELSGPGCPVFYLNYDADPIQSPWRDLIGSVVRFWKGFEYTIMKPRDLFLAWDEVMSRITERAVTSAPARTASGVALSKK